MLSNQLSRPQPSIQPHLLHLSTLCYPTPHLFNLSATLLTYPSSTPSLRYPTPQLLDLLSEHWPDPLLASLKFCTRSARELWSEHLPDSRSFSCPIPQLLHLSANPTLSYHIPQLLRPIIYSVR
eukprot:sb/3475777/